jgi:hypothetical protein
MTDIDTAQVFPERFAALKDMESFTDAMFNRIVAFQEKIHPAWNSERSFDDRIKDLPLHALVFSNPDRDPAQFAHTIAPTIRCATKSAKSSTARDELATIRSFTTLTARMVLSAACWRARACA